MPKPAKSTKPTKSTKSIAATRPAVFAGFDRAAPGFFHELAANMSKAWFDEHKARYEAEWVAPMTALLDDVAARLARAYAPVKLGPPKVMRIYRDTRFAKDKTPYKTHIAGVVPLAGKRIGEGGCAALYLHLGVDEEFVGVGSYFFDAAQLARWRKRVAAEATGKPLAGIVARLRAAGYAVGGHDDYKKVPKPYADDHARAELLRMRGLTAGFPAIPRGLLHDARFAGWLAEHGKATAPLVTWLAHNVK